MIQKVLIADDNRTDRELMQEIVHALDEGIETATAEDGRQACALLESDCFDVIFTDLKMPGKGGLAVLEKAQGSGQTTDVVMVTGHGDVPTAVEAMKKGCFDYLLKPISVGQVEVLLRKLRERRRLVEENTYLRSELAAREGCGEMIGESRHIQRAIAQALHVAPTDATVLLQGETGTGKELFCRLIHDSSPRRRAALIRVNCAALSESILESELFGHEKGAFTGAHRSRAGRFELAHGGTLLLDEITETSQKLQAELLRVIEEREFERVGGMRTIKVDVRIIATTHRDLAAEVREGRFREDLYYRLNVVPLTLPPLRVRGDDVRLLTEFFLAKFAAKAGKRVPAISPEAMEKLSRYSWPGNVRELENLIQRIVIMSGDGSIGAGLLPAYLDEGTPPALCHRAWGRTLEDVEKQAILAALEETGGNRTRAAERLNISTRTIRNKLKKYMAGGCRVESFSP